jgi:hypothetical protein
MSDITTSRWAQVALMLGLAAIAALVAVQYPEVQRYLKIRSM